MLPVNSKMVAAHNIKSYIH